jgi:tetratricopeptide (TPR) repeat protein
MLKARPRLGWLILIFAVAGNAFGQGASGSGWHRLSWPGKDWSLDVSLAPYTVTLDDYSRDEGGYWFVATLRENDLTPDHIPMLIIRLEAAKDGGSATDLRDSIARRLKKSEGVNAGSVKTFEYKQFPALRYSIMNPLARMYSPYPVPPGGMAPMGRGMEAFFVKDDVLITFRLNAVALNKEDEQLFYRVLDSVKFTNTSTPVGSFDYLYRAKALIRQKQYAEALADLNTALGMERKQRQLDAAHWRKLIGHLLDIHSAAGDREQVKTLLDYGVANDPAYPVFQLGLAYYYAAQGDLDNTIAALEKAYVNRKNDRLTAGWAWIDPLTHPAFAQFKQNEKFRRAAKALKR